MHKIEVKTHYRDEPGGRIVVSPDEGTISGISFELSKYRDEALKFLQAHGFETVWRNG